MSEFVEKISLDLDGTAVDGKAAAGLEKTGEGVGKLLEDLKKLAADTGAEAAIGEMSAGMLALGTAAVTAAAAVGAAFLEMMTETAKAAGDVEKYTMQIASAYGGTNDWAFSMERASRVIPGLQKSAILTGASVEELAKSFRSLSLLTDGSDAKVLHLTDSLTVMAKVAGISAETLVSVIQRAALTGQLPLRGAPGREIALNLFPGLSPAEIGAQLKAAQEAGTLLDLLSGKIGDQTDKAKMLSETWETLGGSWSKISALLKVEIGVAWDPFKAVLVEIRNIGMSEEFRSIARAIGELERAWVRLEAGYLLGYFKALKLVTTPARLELEGLLWVLEKIGATGPSVSDLLKPLARGIHPDKIASATEDPFAKEAASYRKLVDDLSRKNDLAGLDGIEKQLEQIADTNDKDVQRIFDAWMKLDPATRKASDAVAAYAIVNDTAAKATSKAWEDVHAKQDALTAKQQVAIGKYREWAALFTETLDLGGLTGLDLALAKNEAQWVKNKNAIDDHTRAVEEFFPIAGLYAVMLDHLADLSKEAMDTKAIDDAARKYGDVYSQIGKLASETASEQIEASRQAREQQLMDLALVGIASAKTWDEVIALVQRAADKSKAINDEAALKQKTILDESTGDWAGYYDDLVKAAVNAGQGIVEAMQSSLKTVAEKAYANAVTMADGVEAALLKIRAGIKSFGQDVADLMTGVWSSMTTAFDTAFYDVLSGKLNDLKNVFKSLWDSILKDFSKMLAQMLEKWLLTQLGMKEGSSGLSGLIGGGSNAVYTPGGTNAISPGSASTEAAYNAELSGIDQQPRGGSSGGMGNAGIYLAAAYGAYTAGSEILAPNQRYQPTYQGQNVPYSGNFGGEGGGAVLGAAAAVTAASIAAGVAIAAAAAAVSATALTTAAVVAAVPVVGWIAAAALVIVAALLYIFSGPAEEHVKVAVADAFAKNGAQGVIGTFVGQIIDSTANFVGSIALKAAGPEGVGKYVSAYQDAFKKAYGTAVFDIAAGSKDDLQKDVQLFFDTVLPKMAMQAGFGQIGVKYGSPAGDRDWKGGLAGLDWNTKNGLMDAAGNFIHEQLFDPAAPIPQLLAGIGFTQAAIGEIATKLSTATDMKVFKQWLSDLIGVVVDLGTLATKFGQTTQQWFDSIHLAQSQEGTAAQFAPDITNLKAAGELLAVTFGDDRVAAGKQLVTDSQTLLTNMGAALTTILGFIDQIKTSTASMIQSYRDKLLTPDEYEATLRTRIGEDFAAIAKAANPKEVAAAWTKVQTDEGSLLDIIVGHINSIKSLLLQVQTLIASINDQAKTSVDNLTMQKMGSVVNGQWVPDVHAQGDYLMKQINDLMGQLGATTTPDQVNALWTQIQGYINQLASQQQDPTHYAESRDILITLTNQVRDAMTAQLTKIGGTLTIELTQAQKDFDTQLGLMQSASDAATKALNGFADDLVTQMGLLTTAIQGWIALFTNATVPPGATTPPPETVPPPEKPTPPEALVTPAQFIAPAPSTEALLDELVKTFSINVQPETKPAEEPRPAPPPPTIYALGVDDAKNAVAEFTAAVKAGTAALSG